MSGRLSTRSTRGLRAEFACKAAYSSAPKCPRGWLASSSIVLQFAKPGIEFGTMEVALISGLGFTFAQEQILGGEGVFDESFLSQLEPTRGLAGFKRRADSTCSSFAGEGETASGKRRKLPCEPLALSDALQQLALPPALLEVVVDVLSAEDSELSDSEDSDGDSDCDENDDAAERPVAAFDIENSEDMFCFYAVPDSDCDSDEEDDSDDEFAMVDVPLTFFAIASDDEEDDEEDSDASDAGCSCSSSASVNASEALSMPALPSNIFSPISACGL